ncbi:hypothetical protein [Acidovorax sp.]|uniref:hypothetical protein n=1 Tax=Acidovorax sp. TaxID=1872122 RepID=UPI0025BD1A97|nr:hypothetical protein [Acidovorax sp.]MBW8461289.1 hypothetical protein [Acidovorax sp.]
MHLRTLANAELARYADSQTNELTSTALEVELLRRLAARAADDAEEEAVLERAAEYDFDADDIRKLGAALIVNATNSAELLTTLAEAGYENAAALKDDLQLAEKFSALACDAGDVLTRLSELAAATNESTNEPATA